MTATLFQSFQIVRRAKVRQTCVFSHFLCNGEVLENEFPCGTDADGLGFLEIDIHSGQHCQNETRRFAASILSLSDEMLMGRLKDHRQRRRLDIGRAFETHLRVQSLEKFCRQTQVFECLDGLV